MERKRIIAVVTNDLSNDRRMIRICTTLVEMGFDVLLLGRKLEHSKPLVDRVFQQKRLTCFFNKGPLFYLEFNVRVLYYMLTHPFEIANSIDADTLLAVGLTCKLKRKKHVHDAHEYFSEVPELTNRKIIKHIWLRIEKMFIPGTDAAYTVSQSIADIYTRTFKKSFALIRNVPDLSIEQAEPQDNVNIIIYQGALNKGRGLEALIEAMKEIEATLWIAGSGDLDSELRNLAKQLNVDDKVVFLGMLSPAALGEYTRKAKIGVNLCEPIGLSYYYALSNKGFDYIQAGIPAITNDFPEYQKLNEQIETMLLIPCEVSDISQAIKRLLNDQALYLKLRKNCLLAKKTLNWQQESEKLKAIYAPFS